jgi:hypothetical protein
MDDVNFSRRLIDIDGEQFLNSEYGVFISNTEKDNRIIQYLEQNAMAAVQSGQAQLKDVVAVLRSDSIGEIQEKLEKASQEVQEREMQKIQEQQQAQQEQLQMQLQAQQEDREDRQAHELEAIDRKGEWDIRKEEIRSFMNQRDQDVNNNGVPDQLEIEKLKLAERRDLRKNQIEEKKIAQKEKEIDIKRKQLSVKNNKK